MGKAIVAPQQEELETKALSWPQQAKALKVVDQDSADKAGLMLVGIKSLRREIDSIFDPIIKKQHEAHRASLAAKKGLDAQLDEAERIIKGNVVGWQMEETRRREEAARQVALAKAKAEHDRLEMEAIGKALAEEGETEEEVVVEIPQQQAVVYVPPPPRVQIAGVSMRTVWNAEITSLPLLLAYISNEAGPQAIELRSAAEVAMLGVLSRLAREQHDELSIPGVRAVPREVAASR